MLNIVMACTLLGTGIAALLTGELFIAIVLFGIGYLVTEVK